MVKEEKIKIMETDKLQIKNNFLTATPFNYKRVGSEYLLVNEWGDFLFLNESDFFKFRHNELLKDKEPYLSLQNNNFIRHDLPLEIIANRYRQTRASLFGGPGLHIMVVTMRCNFHCLYCQVSARSTREKQYDMSKATAAKTLDIIFQTPNKNVAIEFQGGEPLLNWPVVKYIIEAAHKKNRRANKDLQIRLVTNGSLIKKDIVDYLIKQKVSICFSWDGPVKIHNQQRLGSSMADYKKIIKWIKELNKQYSGLKRKGYHWRVNTRLTVTKFSLPFWREIIDEHIKLGLQSTYLHYINPFGLSPKQLKQISYSAKEFLQFYCQALDYIIALNQKGIIFQERIASMFLQKILNKQDPNHVDYRSPCGAGIGQLAYNYNGDVYTCDEGRMLAMTGDESFKIGNVYNNTYKDIVASPVTKTVCTASCIEALPECEQCAYQPYCGVCPVYNYYLGGSLFARIPNNERCQIIKGILDFLFSKLRDKRARKIFENWMK
jgi:His-Xaa-Ser system radical SAM maturase HxsB